MQRNSKPNTKKFVLIGVGLVVGVGVVFNLLAKGEAKKVIRIPHADPELQAASKKAQDGLPDFIKELQSPKPGEGFAIKAAFSTEGGPEYLWVRMPTYKGGVFTGKLDQEPMAVKNMKKGDEVSVPKANVFDWLIKDDSGIRGMFTEKVLANQAPHSEQ